MRIKSLREKKTDKMLVKNRDLESTIKNSDPIFEKNTNLESDTGPDHDISLDVSKYTFLFKKKTLWLLLSSWFQIPNARRIQIQPDPKH